MWAISWATTVARRRRRSSVTFDRNRKSSVKVTIPGFSIAPALKPGTNTWSYESPNGYGRPNSRSCSSKLCRVTVNRSSASRWSRIDRRHHSPSSIPPCRARCTW
jgi:hypothetical protein